MSDPLIGYTLGDYLIESRVGKGGMGVVYAARQLSLERTVAIKILPSELCADREYVDRFLREARAAAQLNHPNVIQIFDAGVAENIYFFVMEFVDGRNLGQILREHGAFAEREALHAIQQAAVGLAFAHSLGVVHRDVKPENIMISQSGLVKIGDLGLAKWKPNEYEASLTSAGTTMGTPFYIAPEQIRGAKDIDARADIYSLGMTLFHLLAGHPAFGEGSAAEIMARHLSDPLPSLRALRPEISEGTGHLLAAMAAKNRNDRIQTMEEVAETLSLMLGHSASGLPRRGSRTPIARQADGMQGMLSRILATGIRGVLAGIVGLLFALVVILAWKKTHPRPTPPALSPPSAEVTPAPTPKKTATSKPKPAVAPTPAPVPTPQPKPVEVARAPTPAPTEVVVHETPAPTPSREARPRAPERTSPVEAPTLPRSAPEERPAPAPVRDTRPATRDLTLQGPGVFSTAVISPRPEQLRAARSGGEGGGSGGNPGRNPRFGGGMDRFQIPGPRMLEMLVAHLPQLEAKSLLRLEFLARDEEVARRFLRQLANCTAATLELTPSRVSDDARDLDIEVCRLLKPWGLVSNLPEVGPETEGEQGSGFIDPMGRVVLEGPMAARLDRQNKLEADTNWKYASGASSGNRAAWNRDGAASSGFDHENNPLPDAANPNRSSFRVTDNRGKTLVLDVLPELQRLAEQARDGSAPPFHHGWIIQVSRGSGEVSFVTASGNRSPRLHLLFGKKDNPAH